VNLILLQMSEPLLTFHLYPELISLARVSELIVAFQIGFIFVLNYLNKIFILLCDVSCSLVILQNVS